MTDGDLSVNVRYDSNGGNSISGTMEITNVSGANISFSDIAVSFLIDDTSSLVFDCYYAGMNSSSGQYSAVSGADGIFEDDRVTVAPSGSGTLDNGGVLTINFAIHRSDWQNLGFSLSADAIEVG